MVDETVPGGAGAQQGTGSDLPAAFMTWRRTANIKRMPGMILMPRWTAEHEPWVQAAIAEHLADDVGSPDLVRFARGRWRFRKPGRRGADAAWPPRPPGEREFLALIARLVDIVRKRDRKAMAAVRAEQTTKSRARHRAIVDAYMRASTPRERNQKALAEALGVSVRTVGAALKLVRSAKLTPRNSVQRINRSDYSLT
ncbi:MAG: hypothetical protein IPI03_17960 [Rubrivivax sp.]|nr:hypothetical protein [Rubrivivax sp.]MBK7263636.1 hypothetical protein [Rubrivivax sp.]MBK8526847.1 hypothetical protein [Rubrivivax sp.]